MKKLFVLLAAFVLFSSVSNAGILDNVKYYGEGSFYGYAIESRGSYEGATVYYGMLGLSADVYENISASFALSYTDLWGISPDDGQSITLNNQSVGVLGKLIIAQANVTLDKLFDVDGLKLKIGRQFYGDEDSAVMYFGVRRDLPAIAALYGLDNREASPINSMDAVTAYYENEHIKANALFATFVNESVATKRNNNITLKGFDFKYLNIANMIDVQGYFYDIENLSTFYGALPRHYNILGAKGTFHKTINENALKASLEIAANYAGSEILSDDIKNLNTGIVKLDASFNISKIDLTPRASFGVYGGYDKKDGRKYFISFGNYYPGLIGGENFSGTSFADTTIINFGADYKISKFSFSFDFFNFSHEQDAWKSSAEIDLQAKYAYTESIYFNVGIAHLFADDSDNDIAYMQAGLSYKF
ncbi:MAG: hypothetical protein LBO62_00590 [Endomicrobium sp.]|jgi:hypothetical protein|nr:hypothetical protein [Endomicrobium sp.]